MNIVCGCGAEYVSKTEPCPAGHMGCLVVHYAEGAHICPQCGTDNVPDLSRGVHLEMGMGVGNIASIATLELRGMAADDLFASLGVPKEFLGGPTNFSSSEMSLQHLDRELSDFGMQSVKYSRFSTEYVEGMEFREFWLKNFPRILALKLGPGPKRLRKKRLKKALGAAYSCHLMGAVIRETVHRSSFAEMILGRPRPVFKEYQQEVERVPHCAACGARHRLPLPQERPRQTPRSLYRTSYRVRVCRV